MYAWSSLLRKPAGRRHLEPTAVDVVEFLVHRPAQNSCSVLMGGGAFAKLCMLTSLGTDPEARLETRVGMGKGVPGAESVEVGQAKSAE